MRIGLPVGGFASLERIAYAREHLMSVLFFAFSYGLTENNDKCRQLMLIFLVCHPPYVRKVPDEIDHALAFISASFRYMFSQNETLH